MASNDEREEAPEDFELLLREDSEIEDDDGVMEYLKLEAEEQEFNSLDVEDIDPEEEESEYPEYVGVDRENDEPPPKRQARTLRSPPHPAFMNVIIPTEEDGDSQQAVTIHSDGKDDIMDEQYHLADEHRMFHSAAEQSERVHRGFGRGRQCRRRGTGGQGRRRPRHTVEPQWKRLVEVCLNDDDVPEDFRQMVKRVVNAREEMRERAIMRTRMRKIADTHEQEWVDDDQNEILCVGEENATRFEWLPMDNYSGEKEQFLPERTGPTVASENAYDAFRQYWDNDILSHIVTETNRYAQELAESSVSFSRAWYDTNIHEVMVLFSFWMMLGIIRMPSTKSCFTNNPLLKTNIFRFMFTRNRYESLCRALHFNDSSKRPTDNSDSLYNFGPIIEHLNSRFQETYTPSQNITVDESWTLWKGNLSFHQNIKTKAAKFELKTFEICDSTTGYLWSFFVYLSTNTAYLSALTSKSASIVLKLVRPLLNKGYSLFMDNRFNSPLLAKFLKINKTDCVGTLRENCRNVPPIISLFKLKEGQFIARHCDDITVMAYQDKKRKISTISTYHGIQQDQLEPKPHCGPEYIPQVILDYNKGMEGVDRKDQMLEPYLLGRKRCAKWTIKVFKRFLNSSIINACILLEASTSTRKHHLVFRLELVNQILQHHHKHVPKKPLRHPESSGSGQPYVFQEIHWPKKITDVLKNGRRIRRRCCRCSQQLKTQRRTSYVCCVCDVPLCLEPCFKLYHSNS